MATADGYVLPKPGVPKTLGILNVIFGVLLFLYGLCLIGSLVAAPAMMEFADKTVKEVQAKAEAQQKEQQVAQDKVFDEREKATEEKEKAATTDEAKKAVEDEKKAIAAEREASKANAPPQIKTVDMSTFTGMMKDPVVMGYSYIQLGTGVILALMLLIAGIGLIRMAAWGGSLSRSWAVLQLLQLVVLAAASLFYVQPIQQKNADEMLAKMEADAKAPNAAPGAAEGAKLARAMSGGGMAAIMTIGYVVAGSIYPIIVLILLNGAGAKAALQGPKARGPADF